VCHFYFCCRYSFMMHSLVGETYPSRLIGEMEFDQHQRPFQRVAGQRVHYIDYTLLLHTDEFALKPYVCLADTMAKDVFFVSPQEWVDRKEGIVYAPSHVTPKLSTDSLQLLCDELVKNQVSISTTIYFFENKKYKIAWRPYPLKGVYKDAGR